VEVVERAVAEPHAPAVPPATAEQVALTALAGTVPQELNVAGALTPRFHVLAALPPVVVHATTALAEPFTVGDVSGSVAEKVMAAGFAEALVIPVASGRGWTTAAAGCPGAAEAAIKIGISMGVIGMEFENKRSLAVAAR